MASKVLFSAAAFSIFFLLSFFAFPVLSNDDTIPLPPQTICNFSPYPSHCRAILPNQTAKVHDFARFSVQKSMFQSHKFFNLVNLYLSQQSTLSKETINALQDCLFLSKLSSQYLSKSNNFALKNTTTTTTTTTTSEVDDTLTLLSAVITNQETCLDGLIREASNSSINNDLITQISNDNKINSVSLALFKKGWVHENKHKSLWGSTEWHPSFKNGRLPMKMSNKTRTIWRGRRKDSNEGGDDDSGVLVRDIVVVSKDGSGNFTTINDAVAAAPNNTINATDGYFLIFIKEGVYEEYISVPQNKAFLMIIGDGINRTIITGNRSVGDGWTTFNSPTFAVVAPGFVAVNITFRNTAGASKFQAVALRSGADMSTFYKCSFEGYQDTLYVHSLRQFYKECDIYGTIDFIFGNAAVVLQDCNIYPRLPLQGQFNPITAQGRTDPNQNTGISIHNCTIKPAADLATNMGTVKTYLGRPWKEYSRTVVMQCYLDSFIDPAGWSIWSGEFALSTLYYAEFDNKGVGANTSNRVTWPGYHVINATDAANFTADNFLQGTVWLPKTGVPYTSTELTTFN